MLPIQQEQIRARTSGQSYSRGEGYFRGGAIFATVRRGNEIEGRCEGSREAPYHVRATLDDNGDIQSTSCTCDYDYPGDCKHIVALLLTYLREPGLFEDLPSDQDALLGRTQEELIALIRQMVAIYPDLQTLVDRPVPSQQRPGRPVDVAPFRRELQHAFGYHSHWGDHTAEATVLSIADTASTFSVAGRWHHASAIYGTILQECRSLREYPVDDEGEFAAALTSVVEATIACLGQAEISADKRERSALIEQLVEVYLWDHEVGGLGVGSELLPDALLPHLRPEDVPGIRAQVLATQQRKRKSELGQWAIAALEHFQMQLDTLEGTDPEETLQRLRQKGLFPLVFQKLLELERLDEAIEVVSKHLIMPQQRLQALPQLVDAGKSDEALRLANETLQKGFDIQLAYWLARRYKASGDNDSLFKLRLQFMSKDPSVGNYAALKEVAEAVNAWTKVRPEILKRLEKHEQYTVLTQIYLHDEEWDAAWETLERTPQRSGADWGWSWMPALDMEVAEKSRHARPSKAIPVYVKYARLQINGGKRDTYNQAAMSLAMVRDLYRQINNEDAWRELINGLRGEFRRLPALQDELTKAGL